MRATPDGRADEMAGARACGAIDRRFRDALEPDGIFTLRGATVRVSRICLYVTDMTRNFAGSGMSYANRLA